MERIKVQSSNIESIGYDLDSSTLEIAFLNGNVYQYFSVPQQEYESLMGSSSKGAYLNSHIKNVYQERKI